MSTTYLALEPYEEALAERAWNILVASGYATRWGNHSDRDAFLRAWEREKSWFDGKMIVEDGACVMASRVDGDTWLLHNLARDRLMPRAEGHRAAVKVLRILADVLVSAGARQYRTYHSPNSAATRWVMEDFAAKSPPGLSMISTNLFRASTLPLRQRRVPKTSPMGLPLEFEETQTGLTLKLHGVPYVMASAWLGEPGENLFGMTDLVRLENVAVEWSREAMLAAATRRYVLAGRCGFLWDDAYLKPEDAEAYGLTHVSAATLAVGTTDTLKALALHLRELERTA